MPPLKLETDELNVELRNCVPRVEVAMTVASVLSVPYANPDCVMPAEFPVASIVPLSVIEVSATLDGSFVLTVGANKLSVVVEIITPYEVLAEFVA